MAMVDVDSGSLYRWTQSKSSGLVLGRQPFYIHQLKRVNSRMALPWWQHHKHCLGIIIIIIIIIMTRLLHLMLFAMLLWRHKDLTCSQSASFICQVTLDMSASDEVLETRPWPRGVLRPNFMASGSMSLASASRSTHWPWPWELYWQFLATLSNSCKITHAPSHQAGTRRRHG